MEVGILDRECKAMPCYYSHLCYPRVSKELYLRKVHVQLFKIVPNLQVVNFVNNFLTILWGRIVLFCINLFDP